MLTGDGVNTDLSAVGGSNNAIWPWELISVDEDIGFVAFVSEEELRKPKATVGLRGSVKNFVSGRG